MLIAKSSRFPLIFTDALTLVAHLFLSVMISGTWYKLYYIRFILNAGYAMFFMIFSIQHH